MRKVLNRVHAHFIDASSELRWFKLTHIEVKKREIHQQKGQLNRLPLSYVVVLPKKVVKKVLKSVMDEVEIKQTQDLSLEPDDFLMMYVANPI